ncbi:MAG TPA: NUDIX domain-containing protein [Caldisericia bacterium]|jgi:8-oxo-dGTP pyrophosphatase MutT (NUDIX family)|nr:MAG: Diadenosine hexaphosphate hydrolase [bacterium ADurb.Bin132]HNW31569.1 NUDIX domain-containing protein [Caldisericia bacterium]HNY61294.1 NUDIX domain-containing protein [Caldisericia bacterium]HOC78773.1 NUDIX domain-containing protein [Caldisericia bacterium]HOG70291.1 NUDIX domain-containing protein [Caldisericia bacterium]
MRYELAATTFVFNGDRFAIHFHEKVKKWLPPGGHVEQNELPHEAAIREVLEELGVKPRLLFNSSPDYGIETVPLPVAILVENIDGEHCHTDMIYAAVSDSETIIEPFSWVTIEEAELMGAPKDVVVLAKECLEIVRKAGSRQQPSSHPHKSL